MTDVTSLAPVLSFGLARWPGVSELCATQWAQGIVGSVHTGCLLAVFGVAFSVPGMHEVGALRNLKEQVVRVPASITVSFDAVTQSCH